MLVGQARIRPFARRSACSVESSLWLQEASPPGGWPQQHTRRTRQPATPNPFDPRATPKLSPRQKYGLPKLADAPTKALRERVPLPQRPQLLTYNEFYQQVVDGTWPRQLAPSSGSGNIAHPHLFAQELVARGAATPALHRKLLPSIHHASHWTKLQRRLLPRYLLLLDAATGPALLKHLPRLQPPRTGAIHTNSSNNSSTAMGRNAEAGRLAQVGTGSAWSTASRTSAAAPTVNAAMDTTAQAYGFRGWAHERLEFELMVRAVCAALRPKLGTFPGASLAEAVIGLGRVGVQGDGFLAVWCPLALDVMGDLNPEQLVLVLKGLANLGFRPSKRWMRQWWYYTSRGMGGLSARQVRRALVAVGMLQLRPPADWWARLYAAVQQQQQQDQQQPVVALGSRQAVDIATSRTVTANSSGGSSLPKRLSQLASILAALAGTSAAPRQEWSTWAATVMLQGMQRQQCGAVAAVDALSGLAQLCPCAASEEWLIACCVLLQQQHFQLPPTRLRALCASLLLLRHRPSDAWLAGLAAATQDQLPLLSNVLHIQLLEAFVEWRWRPGEAWLGALALVSQHRLTGLPLPQLAQLVRCLVALRLAMPSSWVAALLLDLAERTVSSNRSGIVDKGGNIGAGASRGPNAATNKLLLDVLSALPALHGDLPGVVQSQLQPADLVPLVDWGVGLLLAQDVDEETEQVQGALDAIYDALGLSAAAQWQQALLEAHREDVLYEDGVL